MVQKHKLLEYLDKTFHNHRNKLTTKTAILSLYVCKNFCETNTTCI